LIVARTTKALDLPWGKPIGFVPTMGAFHDGHLSLMRAAKAECGFCVCSLFVNPTQFGPSEDFLNYPRDEERDFRLAHQTGVDVMFAPSTEEMYAGSTTTVRVAGVSSRWEGEIRPGHFDGVATIVSKLFHCVRPTHAFFGLKDFQQCAVIGSMVRDLKFPLSLRLLETMREPDGLAMSSRNAYLLPEERSVAPELHRTLLLVSELLRIGTNVDAALPEGRARLSAVGFDVQYLALVDSVTLEPVIAYGANTRLIVAAKLGRTRLIDNIPV
jgi:pantoate--beta-alanine ligase